MEDEIFRQKGAGVPRGIESTAADANPSELSGGGGQPVKVPVWKMFVQNSEFQKQETGAIAGERALLSQAKEPQERWGGDNGRLIRRAGGRLEEFDAEQYGDDPVVGGYARRSVWDKDRRTAMRDAESIGVDLHSPSWKDRILPDKTRKEIELECSVLQETDPRHKELKAKLIADDQARAERRDLERRQYEAKKRAIEIEGTHPDDWWGMRRASAQPTPAQEAAQQVQAGVGAVKQAEVAGADADRREREILQRMSDGVRGPELEKLQSDLSEIRGAREQIVAAREGAVDQTEAAKKVAAKESDKPFFLAEDTISGIWDAVKGLGVTAPAAFYQLVEGLERPDKYSDSAKKAFAEADAYNKEMQAKTAARRELGLSSSTGESARETGQSLGFSIGSMGAQLAPKIAGAIAGAKAGAATGAGTAAIAGQIGPQAATPEEIVTVPAGGLIGGALGAASGWLKGEAVGMATGGTAAYRMAGAMFLKEGFERAAQIKGRELTDPEKADLYEKLLPIARETGLWEAGPEALGNAISLKGLGSILGIGEKAAAKTIGRKIAEKAGAAVGSWAGELATETVTQVGQNANQKQAEAVAQGKSADGIEKDWSPGGIAQAFGEIFPQTTALTAMMMGAGAAMKGGMVAYDALTGKKNATQNEEADIQERLTASVASIDPEAQAPTIDEARRSAFIARESDGIEGIANAILIDRQLSAIEQEDANVRKEADDAVSAAQASGDAKMVKMAEGARDGLGAGRADIVRGALKIAVGKGDMLTSGEMTALGLEEDADGGIIQGKLDVPLVKMGADGSPILTDSLLKRVEEISPMARKQIKLDETQAKDRAQQRADEEASMPEWDVETSNGPVRVRAANGQDAEVMVAESFPAGGVRIRPGSAVQVQQQQNPNVQDNQNQAAAPPVQVSTMPTGTATPASPVTSGGGAPGAGSVQAQGEGAVVNTPVDANQPAPPAKQPASSGTNAKQPVGEKAKKSARKRMQKIAKQSPEIGQAFTTGSPGSNGITISINPDAIIDDAVSRGMNDGEALTRFNAILDEEIKHFAQRRAAAEKWNEIGRPGEFSGWYQSHYGDRWNSEFVQTGKDVVARTLYAKGDKATEARWDSMPDADKFMEATRMMMQRRSGTVTEQTKLWADISKELIEDLKAMLRALRDMVKGIDMTPKLKEDIEFFENELRKLEQNKSRSGASKTDSQEPASGKKGPGTGGKTKEGSAGVSGVGGKTEQTRRDGTVPSLSVGSKVRFKSDSPVLGKYAGQEIEGIVSIVSGDFVRVRPDFDRGISIAMPAAEVVVVGENPSKSQAPVEKGKWTPEIQSEYRKLKARIKRAYGKSEWAEVINAHDDALAYFDSVEAYPDDWSDFERYKDDADSAINRENKSSALKGVPVEKINTPHLKRWAEIVNGLSDKSIMVTVRVGDFFEFFGDDAKIAAPLIDVALTSRNGIPMTGVPVHAQTEFFRKLTKAGYKIAIAKDVVTQDSKVNSGKEDQSPSATDAEQPQTNTTNGQDEKQGQGQGRQEVLNEPATGGKTPVAPTLTPEEEQAKKDLFDAFDGLVDGLQAAPLPELKITQLSPPSDRLPAFQKAIQSLVKASVDSPAKLAAFLEKIAPGKLRPYSEFLWRQVNSFTLGPNVEADWDELYNPKEEKSKSEAISNIAKDVSDMLLADESVTIDRVKNTRPEASVLTKKELDEAIEAGVSLAARTAVQNGRSPDSIYRRLIEIYINQPSLNAKTSSSKINQAYSTPAPLAYVASRLADVKGGNVVTEHSAGHGMLLMETSDDQIVQYNEIDKARRERTLLAIPDSAKWKMSGNDGTTWVPSMESDRSIGNPPFGTLMGENGENVTFSTEAGETTAIDHAIMLNALSNMSENGRAVFIIGGPAKTAQSEKARKEHYGKGSKGKFFKYLYDNFGVVDHFTVDGDLYSKQGAGWNVDVIVIQGKRPSRITLPTAKAPRMVSTWADLFQTTQLTDEERIAKNTLSEEEVRAGVLSSLDKLRDRPKRPQGSEPQGKGGDASRSGNGPNTRPNGGLSAETSVGQGEGNGRSDSAVDGIEGRAGNVGQEPGGRGSSGVATGNAGNATESVRPILGNEGVNSDDKFQDEYVPGSEGPTLGTLIPKNLTKPVKDALSDLIERRGKLHEFVRSELGYGKDEDIFKYFAAEQIDALALAIDNFYRNGALVVGDQTGIGKGRVVAGLIKWTINHDLIPIFVTKNPSLMHAMLKDDLPDIGVNDFKPVITNNRSSELLDTIPEIKERGIQCGKAVFESIAESGRLPGNASTIFTSYSQICSDTPKSVSKKDRNRAKANKQAPPDAWRMAALRRLAPKSVMILDESHLAAGDSIIRYRFAELLGAAKHVYFSSATFAKRPENMALYFRTNMSLVTGGDIEAAVQIMEQGGVPAMQLASNMLARDGQMIRRERSFDGVDFATVINRDTQDRDYRIADQYTAGLRKIVLLQGEMEAAAEAINEIISNFSKKAKASGAPKLESVNFSSKLHNMVSQYLLAIKSESAVQQAIKEVKAGNKVVVTVQNTMQSAINNLQSKGLPLTFHGLLMSYVDDMRYFKTGERNPDGTQKTMEIKRTPDPRFKGMSDQELHGKLTYSVPSVDSEGQPTVKIALDEDVAGELVRRAMIDVFLEYENEVRRLDVGDEIPLSPIDYMRQAMEREGITTNEITGRSVGLDENGDVYSRSGQASTEVMGLFNNSDTHFLVLNQSGSTGISLHASEKFEDKRRRTMIVVQPNLDINEFMQTLGRIHRSGQVTLPRFVLLQTALPAELRPAAILGLKMAMLNANTTSNDESAVSEGNKAVDIFNKYGDQVVHQVLSQDKDLLGQLSIFGKIEDLLDKDGNLSAWSELQSSSTMAEQPDGYFARLVTGYLAIMPAEEQELFWEKTTSEYNTMIEWLDQIGQNELRAQSMDIKAKTISREVFTGGTDGDSVFAEPSYIETVQAEIGKKPISADEAESIVRENRAKSEQMRVEYSKKALAKIDETSKEKAKKVKDWEDKKGDWVTSERQRAGIVAHGITMMGKWLEFKRPDGSIGNAVIESVKFDEDAITTPSKQIFNVFVNDTNKTLRVPATKLRELYTEVMGANYSNAGKDAWNENKDESSIRSIVTGNLLAALVEIGQEGQVISYTTDKGETQMGIMLPANYTARKQAQEKRRIKIGNADDFSGQVRSGSVIQNSDGAVKIATNRDGKYVIQFPASRSAGGKYWRDPRLNRLTTTGEFTQISNRMEGVIAGNKLNELYSILANQMGETLFVSAENQDGPQAGENLQASPLPSRSDSSEWKSMTREERMNALKSSKGLQAAPLPERPKNQFYSQLSRAIEAKMPKSATPEQVLQIASSGAKSEEVKWSGLIPWLQGRDKVSKDEVLKYLEEEGSVRFGEVDSDKKEYERYTLPGGENYREVVLTMPVKLGPNRTIRQREDGNWEIVHPDNKVSAAFVSKEAAEEALSVAAARNPEKYDTYTSNHFQDIPNYVAHMRTNERDGGLFIEELQSDRHQAGRKKGYAEPMQTEDEIPAGYAIRETEGGLHALYHQSNGYESLVGSFRDHTRAVQQAFTDANSGKVADAPFRTTWPLSLFKRALRDAVESGKEWIGWTTGETQNERFDLSKHIDTITTEKTSKGDWKLEILPYGGGRMDTQFVKESELEGAVGKELAAKIVADGGGKKYSGLDLKVGGSGMKGFYDTMLPKEIGKYVKQWGGKVEKGGVSKPNIEMSMFRGRWTVTETDEDGNESRIGQFDTYDEAEKASSVPIWRIDITPEMRNGVMAGQSLFAAPLPEQDANIKRLRFKMKGSINKALADEARLQQQAFGYIGTPRLANPGDTQRSRDEQDIVDALYEHQRTVRKDRDVFEEARRRLQQDPKGVEEKLLQIAEGKTFATDDADFAAFSMLINQRAMEAGNDLAKHNENMELRMALRAMRKETARELRIGYDRFLSPEERARKAIADAIYTPSLKIEKKAQQLGFSPQKQREFIRQASKERIQQIEKALKKMGVTIDEILSGQAYLSLSQDSIMKQALAVRTAEEKMVIKMLQAKTPIDRIIKQTNFTESRIEEIRKRLWDELYEKIRVKVAAGAKLENFRDEFKGLKAAPLPDESAKGLTEAQIDAEVRRIIEAGFGIPAETPKASVAKPKRKKEKVDTDPLTADWARPVFEDGLNGYEFDTKDRAEIMNRLQAIRAVASATGKINLLTGKKRDQAVKLLDELNQILGKYGTDAQGIFDAAKPVEDYKFNIRDRAHVAAVARAIQAIDADIVDKGIEWVYSSILSGIQTMTVNAMAAAPAAWDMTVGRGFEMAVNTLFRDPMAATPQEVKYILKAAHPALSRAMSNAAATWGSELPMFDEDFLGHAIDMDKLFDGHAPKVGVIGGRKGHIIRTPLRILLATDEFNRTAIAVAEVGAMAYRLAMKQGMKPGTAEFDKFLAREVNTPGSYSSMLAAQSASQSIFTSPLPGQKDPIDGSRVPIEGVGDVIGWGAGKLNELVTAKTDNLFAKTLMAILRVTFFPFQRTPFNLIRRGVRHTLNPVSMIDILFLMGRNSIVTDKDGKIKWQWNAMGRNPEIIKRLSQQAQGAVLLFSLMALAAGEGDEDDLKKLLVITGSQPFTLKGMAERNAQMRAGLGPYRFSFRNKDGSERFGFNYGRLEPLATTLAATIDTIKAIKRTERAGKDATDIASSMIGGLAAQAQDKTYMQGFADLYSLLNNVMESDESLKDNRKFQQFIASRVAMAMPNIIKQPIREGDPAFRERSDSFMQELLYQVAPAGQKPVKIDPYGEKMLKTGNWVGRAFDVTDAGTDKVNPYDDVLLRWRDKHPDKAWFPSDIRNASFTNPRTGKEVEMNQSQLDEFKKIAGKRVMAMLKRESINFNNPTALDIERIKKSFSSARSEAKKMIALKYSKP